MQKQDNSFSFSANIDIDIAQNKVTLDQLILTINVSIKQNFLRSYLYLKSQSWSPFELFSSPPWSWPSSLVGQFQKPETRSAVIQSTYPLWVVAAFLRAAPALKVEQLMSVWLVSKRILMHSTRTSLRKMQLNYFSLGLMRKDAWLKILGLKPREKYTQSVSVLLIWTALASQRWVGSYL